MKKNKQLSQSTSGLSALTHEQLRTGKIPFNAVTMATIICLQRLDSSVLKKIRPDEFGPAEIIAALFVLTQPIELVYSLLDSCDESGSYPKFEKAVFDLASRVPADAITTIAASLNAHLVSAFGAADHPPVAPVKGKLNA